MSLAWYSDLEVTSTYFFFNWLSIAVRGRNIFLEFACTNCPFYIGNLIFPSLFPPLHCPFLHGCSIHSSNKQNVTEPLKVVIKIVSVLKIRILFSRISGPPSCQILVDPSKTCWTSVCSSSTISSSWKGGYEHQQVWIFAGHYQIWCITLTS